jgi:hypothetical protein
MRKTLLILPVFIIILLSENNYSQTCRDVSVELVAAVQVSPPLITLYWVASTTTTDYIVYRKLKIDNGWGTAVDTVTGTETHYIDSTVTAGISYEYKVVRIGTNYTGYGYINAGIEIPVTEQRGVIILVVDNRFSNSLSSELKRLEDDLEGDGWKVIRHDVLPTVLVSEVKALIVTDYNVDPENTKAVFLVGHIPVPYSGNINPDGHPDHKGAWPADVYYAEMNGTWTDATVNTTNATDPRNHNIPGDGKFDQSILPSDVELQIGRIDFWNLPAFTSSEEQLIKNYLDKDHAYRHQVFTAIHRGVIDDNFGYFSGEAFAASGWKNMGPLVGPGNVTEGDYFTTMTGNSYLWSYGCGGGWYQGASGIGSTADFASSDLQGVFTLLFGSYFGDWDTPDNFLRAALAQGKMLTNAWSGRPHWQFHHMALGENIGYDVRVSQNNNNLYYANYGARFIHIALMGDPTLRNDIVAPVSGVVATTSGINCNLSWTASPDIVLGYNIYMKNDTMTEYIRVNQNPVTGTSFTDSCLLYPGVYSYMVRALVLQSSPSGTYYNLSQGITDTAWNDNDLKVHAAAEYSISNNVVTFTNASINATTYLWDFGDGETSTQQNPVHTFLYGNYTVTLIAGNLCNTDTILIFISVVTGIETPDDPFFISVYPNPSPGKFNLTLDYTMNTSVGIKIYNIMGKLIMEREISKYKNEIDLSAYPNGIYVLSISKEKEKYRQKIIIQK